MGKELQVKRPSAAQRRNRRWITPRNTERHMAKLLHLLQTHLLRQGVGILATATKEGMPHATVLGTLACPSLDRLITMTSPESSKTLNILENPHVEWMFFDPDKQTILYLRGRVRVIQDPEEVKKAWRALSDKSRAFFLSFQTEIGMQFLILETQVESVEYLIPRRNACFYFPIERRDQSESESRPNGD